VGGAKKALMAIKNVKDLADSFSSAGYAAVFPE